MDWLTLIVSNAVTLVTSLGGTILYFRPKLKEANANAAKAQVESEDFQYHVLIDRINSMEKMYNEQLKEQNQTIADLRSEVLKLTKEKFTSDQKIVQLEGENTRFKTRIDALEKELQEYKTRNK